MSQGIGWLERSEQAAREVAKRRHPAKGTGTLAELEEWLRIIEAITPGEAPGAAWPVTGITEAN